MVSCRIMTASWLRHTRGTSAHKLGTNVSPSRQYSNAAATASDHHRQRALARKKWRLCEVLVCLSTLTRSGGTSGASGTDEGDTARGGVSAIV